MTLENVERIITETKSACPDVNFIIEAVYPINENMRDKFEKRSNKKINEMNSEFIKLCKKYNCIWLDFTESLKDCNGNLKDELTYDGLHVNVEAYKIISENVIPLLK